MGWVLTHPTLAIGLGLFLGCFVASRVVITGVLDLLDDAQRLRLMKAPQRGHGWLAAFVACAVAAFLWPRFGVFAIAGYFLVATAHRLRWLAGADFPVPFMRRATLSSWLLVAGFFALALGVCLQTPWTPQP